MSSSPRSEAPAPAEGLRAEALRIAYPGAEDVVHGVDVTLRRGAMTVIVGPNGCGKSTLLRAMGRILHPSGGQVTLDGRALAAHGTREFARAVSFLPQSSTALGQMTVADLVSRGRYPHQGLLRQWSGADERAVRSAMERTRVAELAAREVATLSGGQRQRVWIAMVLAQETDVLLLDEPTTYLDVAHQMEILDLCLELRERDGVSIVAVLHDLGQAARYAEHVVAMHEGLVHSQGTAEQVMTPAMLAEVFGIDARVIPDPETGTPLVVPRAGPALRRRAEVARDGAGEARPRS